MKSEAQTMQRNTKETPYGTTIVSGKILECTLEDMGSCQADFSQAACACGSGGGGCSNGYSRYSRATCM